jgi:hypothetical protein
MFVYRRWNKMTITELFYQAKDKEAVINLFDLLSQRAPAEAIRKAEHNLTIYDWKLCRQIVRQIKQGEKLH